MLESFVTMDGSLVMRNRKRLEGKYSLESTDPRESEIRALLNPYHT